MDVIRPHDEQLLSIVAAESEKQWNPDCRLAVPTAFESNRARFRHFLSLPTVFTAIPRPFSIQELFQPFSALNRQVSHWHSEEKEILSDQEVNYYRKNKATNMIAFIKNACIAIKFIMTKSGMRLIKCNRVRLFTKYYK